MPKARSQAGDHRLTSTNRGTTSYEADPGSTIWPVVELIEAATRTGATDTAKTAYDRLSEMTAASNTNWARGIQARSFALVAPDGEAEAHYNESIVCLGRTGCEPTWPGSIRFTGMASPWPSAQRLAVCAPPTACLRRWAWMPSQSERGVNRSWPARMSAESLPLTRGAELTAQETQIARLARDGLSNPEIRNGSSSASTPSNTTCARPSRNSVSLRGPGLRFCRGLMN